MSRGSLNGRKKKEKEKNEIETKPVNIMLLLMPDYGDRYELVPVKVQSKRQTIEELIKEVQEKATIRSLRNQNYHCVCNGDGTVLNSQSIIENYFHTDIGEELYHLVITVPYGKSAKEIVKIAKPILTDENVSKKIAKITDRQISIDSNEFSLSQMDDVSDVSEDSYSKDKSRRRSSFNLSYSSSSF